MLGQLKLEVLGQRSVPWVPSVVLCREPSLAAFEKASGTKAAGHIERVWRAGRASLACLAADC